MVNMSAPPSINLVGEVYTAAALCRYSFLVAVPIAAVIFLSAGYSLYLYAGTQHGPRSEGAPASSAGRVLEHLLMFLH